MGLTGNTYLIYPSMKLWNAFFNSEAYDGFVDKNVSVLDPKGAPEDGGYDVKKSFADNYMYMSNLIVRKKIEKDFPDPAIREKTEMFFQMMELIGKQIDNTATHEEMEEYKRLASALSYENGDASFLSTLENYVDQHPEAADTDTYELLFFMANHAQTHAETLYANKLFAEFDLEGGKAELKQQNEKASTQLKDAFAELKEKEAEKAKETKKKLGDIILKEAKDDLNLKKNLSDDMSLIDKLDKSIKAKEKEISETSMLLQEKRAELEAKLAKISEIRLKREQADELNEQLDRDINTFSKKIKDLDEKKTTLLEDLKPKMFKKKSATTEADVKELDKKISELILHMQPIEVEKQKNEESVRELGDINVFEAAAEKLKDEIKAVEAKLANQSKERNSLKDGFNKQFNLLDEAKKLGGNVMDKFGLDPKSVKDDVVVKDLDEKLAKMNGAQAKVSEVENAFAATKDLQTQTVNSLVSGLFEHKKDMFASMAKRLEFLDRNVEKYSDPKHENSKEFTEMRNALKETCEMTKAFAEALKGTVSTEEMQMYKETVIGKIKSMLEKAQNYKTEKTKGIHLIKNRMRTQRLLIADSLIDFSKKAKENIASEENIITEQAKKIKEYAEYKVPGLKEVKASMEKAPEQKPEAVAPVNNLGAMH